MAAILRVKRRRNDDPADSLVVSSKRFKESSELEGACAEETDVVDSVFKFAGTVNKKDTPVGQQVRDAIRKAKLQREVLRQHTSSPNTGTLRAREEHSKSSADARYKVVAKKRALGWDELDTEKDEEEEKDEASAEGQKLFHLLDLVTDIHEEDTAQKPAVPETFTCNGVSMIREPVEQEKDCVYDLYYINDPHFNLQNLDNWKIEARWEQEFMDERAESEDEQCYEREYDTDDENNPINDYPDEEPRYPRALNQNSDSDDDEGEEYRDPFDSDDEEYYAQMLEDKLIMGEVCEEGDLSSEEDENFVYFKEDDAAGTVSAYEKYKKRVVNELEAHDEDEEEEEEGDDS